MSKNEQPLKALTNFLPENSFEAVADYIVKHKVHLTISKERKSVLGDYRNAISNRNHRISVNGNLNKYAFLVTLLHELAHLLTFDKYGHKVQSHGREWKHQFGLLLANFIERNIFPADIKAELVASLQNPAASSCAEDGLMRVLRNYDPKKQGFMLVEEIPIGSIFKTADGRRFVKGERLRKRFRCIEVGSKKVYLFSPVYEVELDELQSENIDQEAKLTDNFTLPTPKEGYQFLTALPNNTVFSIEDGRKFKKIQKLRKRIKCQELSSEGYFLFSALYPVKIN